MINPCRFLGGIPEQLSESCHLFSLLCRRNGLRLNDIFVFNLEDEASECICTFMWPQIHTDTHFTIIMIISSTVFFFFFLFLIPHFALVLSLSLKSCNENPLQLFNLGEPLMLNGPAVFFLYHMATLKRMLNVKLDADF